MLIILQELMHRTFVEIEGRAPKRHEIPKPCDHFDLIAGNGTGGLIALMLGRLRMDLDTCKDVYVRMTRRVFETDKTFAGIPLKSTMFKASKLEEVIRECVKEHTVFEDEGNDTLANATPISPDMPSNTSTPVASDFPQRTLSQSSRYSQLSLSPSTQRNVGFGSLRLGDPNALLYDTRENRTKTAVTAVLKGTSQTVLLRSYDSRKEPAPEVNCTIWQAGRATSAAAMAFKPIRIGQSWYLDEGAGKYNPAPLILDEAVRNEWPGREIGVFVSIGTGKRPASTNNQQHEWWEGFLGGTMGDFAEARRRLISKLEGCEETHKFMLNEYLTERQVNVENYYRLNVEVGVGEFGMNEWARLSEISTNTRIYLAQREIEMMIQSAAAKLAKVHLARIRHQRAEAREQNLQHPGPRNSWQNQWDRPLPSVPSNPMAVELPGDDMFYQTPVPRPGSFEHRPSVAEQKYTVVPEDAYPISPNSMQNTSQQRPVQPYSGGNKIPPQSLGHQNSTSSVHSHANSHQSVPSPRQSTEHQTPLPQQLQRHQQQASPPPLPPKTPLPYPDYQQSAVSPQNVNSFGGPRTFMNMGELGRRLPYPDVPGPPPAVNTANKPSLS